MAGRRLPAADDGGFWPGWHRAGSWSLVPLRSGGVSGVMGDKRVVSHLLPRRQTQLHEDPVSAWFYLSENIWGCFCFFKRENRHETPLAAGSRAPRSHVGAQRLPGGSMAGAFPLHTAGSVCASVCPACQGWAEVCSQGWRGGFPPDGANAGGPRALLSHQPPVSESGGRWALESITPEQGFGVPQHGDLADGRHSPACPLPAAGLEYESSAQGTPLLGCGWLQGQGGLSWGILIGTIHHALASLKPSTTKGPWPVAWGQLRGDDGRGDVGSSVLPGVTHRLGSPAAGVGGLNSPHSPAGVPAL